MGFPNRIAGGSLRRVVLTFPNKTAAVYPRRLASRPHTRIAAKFLTSLATRSPSGLVAVSLGNTVPTRLARWQGRCASPRNGDLGPMIDLFDFRKSLFHVVYSNF